MTLDGIYITKKARESFPHFIFLVPVIFAPLMLCTDPSVPVKGTDFIQQAWYDSERNSMPGDPGVTSTLLDA